MKLLLHIGTEKPGTTAIQQCLSGAQQELRRQGVALSSVLGTLNQQLLAHAFQRSIDPHLRAQGIRSEDAFVRFRDDLVSGLAKEVRTSSEEYDWMVISSEQLQSRLLSASEVSSLAKCLHQIFDSVCVVCYLRPQLQMRRSLYSTMVRMGYRRPLHEFDADISDASLYYNHEALVDRWVTAFGQSNVVLREFQRSAFVGGDVVLDFLAACPFALDPSRIRTGSIQDNSSLSGLHISAYRLVNAILPFSDGDGNWMKGNARAKRSVDWALSPLASLLPPMTLSAKEEAVGAAIKMRFERSNARLSDLYFGGRLFSSY